MDDLSLHVLDIVENAIAVKASRVSVNFVEDPDNDWCFLEIVDDGPGMDAQALRSAADPFFTSKPGKRIGLGLPLLGQAAEETGGHLEIDSEVGRGTTVRAWLRSSHIDCRPLGDMDLTMRILRATHPEIQFDYQHQRGTAEFPGSHNKRGKKNDETET